MISLGELHPHFILKNAVQSLLSEEPCCICHEKPLTKQAALSSLAGGVGLVCALPFTRLHAHTFTQIGDIHLQ